ncbi:MULTISPECIES: hypothetical protein [unclassified Leptospira]|uniref:hypothetical protein n=1 Tax=unclassified Leptospira TaxID=2633828 RepID=UPI0002BD9EDA|nr:MULTISPECIES: hypothetical protein [unclassified Leptospira]EMK02344.1 hypothetical protein LEP1GSC192_0454 [Leptospira sp. B5-022]MCR1795721.1 hypothetical protein [Leptospira sp. id769339]
MFRKITIVYIVLGILILGELFPQEIKQLPNPPEGYQWLSLKEIKGFILKPKNYYFKTEVKGGTIAYFVTKEDIDKLGRFKTGLSINVVRGLKDKKAIDLVGSYYESYKSKQNLLSSDRITLDVIDGVRIRFVDLNEAENEKVRQEIIFLANTKTNTFYIISFEYPEKDASASEKVGPTILNNLALETEI